MATIPLRTTEFAARLAKEVSKRSTEPLHLSQLLVAALYGYRDWQHLVASVDPNGERFDFDEDLSEDQQNRRTLEQAKNLAQVMDLPLRQAIDIALSVHVTADHRRFAQRPPRYYPEAFFHNDLVLDQNSWWVSQIETEHPLAPPGFDVVCMANDADLSTLRLGHVTPKREFTALLPSNLRPIFYPYISHLHLRRDDFVVIEQVPWAFVFENSKRVPMTNRDFWSTKYDRADHAAEAVRLFRQSYRAAIEASRAMNNPFTEGGQIPVNVRTAMGNGDPLWPLRPVCETARQCALRDEIKDSLHRRSAAH